MRYSKIIIAALMAMAVSIPLVTSCGWLEDVFGTPQIEGSVLAIVVGSVRDSDFNAVNGALVRVGADGPATMTDNSGHFLINVPSGSWYLEIMKDDYCTRMTSSIYVDADNRIAEINTVLYNHDESSYGGILGQVALDGASDLSGATVRIAGTETASDSDSSGWYHMLKLTSGTYNLNIERHGYTSSQTSDISVRAGEITRVDFSLNDSSSPWAFEIHPKEDHVRTVDVELEIDAYDDGSGVAEMLLSQQQNFYDTTDNNWQPYLDETTFTIADTEGKQYIYAKVRDGAGRQSNVIMTAVTLDKTPPPAVQDFMKISSPGEYPVKLTWTDTMDSGDGQVVEYDIRFNKGPITTANWFDLPGASEEPAPGSGGTLQANVWDIYEDGTYNFAIRAIDRAGNLSPVSNIVSDTLTRTLKALVPDGQNGMLVYDIPSMNPASTTGGNPVAMVPTDTGDMRGIEMLGPFAYVANYLKGMQIMDTNTPTGPSWINTSIAPPYHCTQVETNFNKEKGKMYMYMLSYSGGLYIFDMTGNSFPTPEFVNLIFVSTPMDVLVDDDIVFLAAGTNGVYIYDIKDPEDPQLLSQVTNQDQAKAIDVYGDYLYVASDSAGLQVVDISDLEDPRMVCTVPMEHARDVVAQKNYAYVANYEETRGLVIVNVMDPETPWIYQELDIKMSGSGKARTISKLGHYAYVCDGDFKIIDVADPAAPSIVFEGITPGIARNARVR